MFDSRGLPDYPPPHNAWEFPPPPVSKRWLWVAVMATVLAVASAVTLTVTAVSLGDDDYRGVIQDTDLVNLIADECDLMTSTVESMPVDGPVRQQAATVIDQNQAVEEMLDAIRARPEAVSADRPAELWLSDWDTLLTLRERYAADISRGLEPDLTVPEDDDGVPIYVRMDDAFVDESVCEVPVALLNPYPDPSDDI